MPVDSLASFQEVVGSNPRESAIIDTCINSPDHDRGKIYDINGSDKSQLR